MAELDDADTAALATVEHWRVGSVAVLKLCGEIDLTSVDRVRRAIEPVLDARPAEVVFDLGGLRFMDSSGVGLLLVVAERIGAVSLRSPSPIVKRIVEATGLSELLPIVQ